MVGSILFRARYEFFSRSAGRSTEKTDGMGLLLETKLGKLHFLVEIVKLIELIGAVLPGLKSAKVLLILPSPRASDLK